MSTIMVVFVLLLLALALLSTVGISEVDDEIYRGRPRGGGGRR